MKHRENIVLSTGLSSLHHLWEKTQYPLPDWFTVLHIQDTYSTHHFFLGNYWLPDVYVTVVLGVKMGFLLHHLPSLCDFHTTLFFVLFMIFLIEEILSYPKCLAWARLNQDEKNWFIFYTGCSALVSAPCYNSSQRIENPTILTLFCMLLTCNSSFFLFQPPLKQIRFYPKEQSICSSILHRTISSTSVPH